MIRFLWTYIVAFYYILTQKSKLTDDFFYNSQFVYTISKNTVRAAGYRIKIIGRENLPQEDGILYVANHQSFFDIFASMYIINRQLGFIAKKQLKNFFSVGLYVVKAGGVLIDRDNIKSQVEVLLQLTKNVRAGYNAFIFPEGTRSRDGRLGEFKSGSFRIAVKSKCRIVPITFFDNYQVVTNKGDDTIKIQINKPIPFEIHENMNTAQLSEYVKSIIQNNLNQGFDLNKAEDF